MPVRPYSQWKKYGRARVCLLHFNVESDAGALLSLFPPSCIMAIPYLYHDQIYPLPSFNPLPITLHGASQGSSEDKTPEGPRAGEELEEIRRSEYNVWR